LEFPKCKVYNNEYNEKHDGKFPRNNSIAKLQQRTQFKP
jgi:hypothetical protein